ncbi:hypothetical protein P170DRAFT_435178, partial [Aspergillus steynii IBT 23096]
MTVLCSRSTWSCWVSACVRPLIPAQQQQVILRRAMAQSQAICLTAALAIAQGTEMNSPGINADMISMAGHQM